MDDLRELFEGFSIHLQAAGRRPSTVDWYAKHARRFFSWLDQESIPATVSAISVLRIRKFIAYQQSSVQAWDSNPYVLPSNGVCRPVTSWVACERCAPGSTGCKMKAS